MYPVFCPRSASSSCIQSQNRRLLKFDVLSTTGVVTVRAQVVLRLITGHKSGRDATEDFEQYGSNSGSSDYSAVSDDMLECPNSILIPRQFFWSPRTTAMAAMLRKTSTGDLVLTIQICTRPRRNQRDRSSVQANAANILQGCLGPLVKASGWPSFDRQFEP